MKLRHALLYLLIAASLSQRSEASPLSLPDPINLLKQSQIFGDGFGYRREAADHGVIFTAQSTSDLFGNTTGGMTTGSTYSGLLNLALTADLQKAVGWEGASFKSAWLWLYGNDISQKYVGNSLTVSSAAGYPAFRASELWLQQNLFHDAFSLRAGLLALDTEFLASDTASLFVNSTFGPPALFTLNIPNGGPTYPFALPGVRLAVQPTSWLTLRSALTQANPFAQNVNRNGFDWNFGPARGLLSLNELAVTWNQNASSSALPGTAKAGFWFQNSQEELTSGIAPSAFTSGFYGIIDQQLYAVPNKAVPDKASGSTTAGGKNPQPAAPSCTCSGKGLSSFCRAGFSPQPGSSSSLYADAGLVYTRLIPSRDADKLGIAFAYSKVGSLTAAETASAGYPGSFEAVAELSYSLQFSQAVSIQPDLQYILHPGGTQQYGNALVLGVRAVVNF